MKRPHMLSLLLIFLIGCSAITGEEVARLPINEISTENNLVVKEVSLDLKKDEEIAFWSDIDMEYEGDASLRFRVEVLKNGEDFGGFEIDPTDKSMTLGEVRTTIMDKTDWSFSGKNSEVKIEEDGKYTFKAILVSSDNPSLKIEKAELVIKK